MHTNTTTGSPAEFSQQSSPCCFFQRDNQLCEFRSVCQFWNRRAAELKELAEEVGLFALRRELVSSAHLTGRDAELAEVFLVHEVFWSLHETVTRLRRGNCCRL